MAFNEPAVTQFSPYTGALGLPQILGNKKKGLYPILPLSRSAWFRGIRAGKFPPGSLVGSRRMWLASDIAALLKSLSAGEVSK